MTEHWTRDRPDARQATAGGDDLARVLPLRAFRLEWVDGRSGKKDLGPLPQVPDLGATAELCAWLTTVFGLDPSKPIVGGERKGLRGPEGRIELYRAGAPTLPFEPARTVNQPPRLIEAVSNYAVPTDGKVPPIRAAHCADIVLAIRRLCGESQQLSDDEETLGIIGAFLAGDVEPVAGYTTYGDGVQRYEAAVALGHRREAHTGRPYGTARFLVDANTGELVIGIGDLAAAARRHLGVSLKHGWLDGRMESAGWQRLIIEGWEEPGHRGGHRKFQAYRGMWGLP
jgi:hypothetical protein